MDGRRDVMLEAGRFYAARRLRVQLENGGWADFHARKDRVLGILFLGGMDDGEFHNDEITRRMRALGFVAPLEEELDRLENVDLLGRRHALHCEDKYCGGCD